MLVFKPDMGIEAYRDRCANEIPAFKECWSDFSNVLVHNAEIGTRRTIGNRKYYYELVARYEPPKANIRIWIEASYIISTDRVLLLSMRVRSKAFLT